MDLCAERSILMNVQQNNGKALPVFSFTEWQIMEKYKRFTDVDPITLTLIGPRNVILEFDRKDDVITSSTWAHRLHQWDNIGMNIHCIAAPKAHLIEIFSQTEQPKKETQQLVREKEAVHQEKQQCKEWLTTVLQQMSRKINYLDKKIDEAPFMPSGIVTTEQMHEVTSSQGEQQQVLVSAPSTQLVMSSGLPLFSGSDPTPRDKSMYEKWKLVSI